MMAKPMKILQPIVFSNDPVALINNYSPKAKWLVNIYQDEVEVNIDQWSLRLSPSAKNC